MNNKIRMGLVVLASLAWSSTISAAEDAFGIIQLYPTQQDSLEWDSTHWANGNLRDFTGNRDPDDPTNWSESRGNNDLTSVDGAGVMRLEGSSPALNIDSYEGNDTAEQSFNNVEATIYFKHTVVGTKAWSGLIMGLRANDDPDTSCDDQAYWTRLRHDGKWDFLKELNGKSKGTSQIALFDGEPLPTDQWLGMKFLAYNIDVGDEVHVKLELYLDLISDGDVSNGGDWQLVGEKIDDGTWGGHDLGTCSYSDGHIITESAGIAIVKNSGDETTADYKYFSVREIDTTGTSTTDAFGITKFFATKAGSKEWVSNWDNGSARSVGSSERDPEDPTGYTQRRGNASTFNIDGAGILEMGGSQPRIYINPYDGNEITNPDQLFKNVEGTVYYKRTGSDGANWGGLIMGLRSGPLGHSSTNYDPAANYCDANTYYARFRHDGTWDFEKELRHGDETSSGTQSLFPGGLPADQWIGMKYLAYNINNDTQVKLELWIDDTSDGDTTDGGEWRLVGELIDDGNWSAGNIEDCPYSDTKIITEGGGIAFIRNTDAAKAEYKNFSIREIDPSSRYTIPPAEVTPSAVEIMADLIVASSDDGNIAANVFDDDLSTRWSAQGNGEHLTIDLSAQYYLTELHVAWSKGDERQSHYEVQISDDDINWESVAEGSSSGATTALEYIGVKDSARYVRIIGKGNTSNDWNSITEVKIFGVTPAEITPGAVEVTPASITASTEEDPNFAVNVYDGDSSTRWSAEGDGEFLTFDLGVQYSVTEIHAQWLSGDKRKSHYEIQTSDDGTTWESVTSGSSSGISPELENIDVKQSARYVRYVGFGNSSNAWNSVQEIKIFALPAAEVTEGSAEITPASITASSEEAPNLAANVSDGDSSTRWSAEGEGEFLTIDLGAQYSVTEIHAQWLSGNARQSHYQIEISDDATAWVTVVDGSSTGATSELEYIAINESARYIRYIGFGNTLNDWNSVQEIKIFGTAEIVPYVYVPSGITVKKQSGGGSLGFGLFLMALGLARRIFK